MTHQSLGRMITGDCSYTIPVPLQHLPNYCNAAWRTKEKIAHTLYLHVVVVIKSTHRWSEKGKANQELTNRSKSLLIVSYLRQYIQQYKIEKGVKPIARVSYPHVVLPPFSNTQHSCFWNWKEVFHTPKRES
jgi:hypothetical protein